MKKLLSTLLCLSVVTGIAPLSSSAVSEPIYIENGAESWSKTVISGDVNDDGKLSIADAVILQQCIMDNYSPDDDSELNEAKLDVNFDGSFDVFDMVLMRQTVLHPETAPSQTWAIDILNSAEMPEIPEKPERFSRFASTYNSGFFTTYSEMCEYLSALITDGSEVQKYLDRYDESFFEENNLILEPFVQERGNGIFYEILGTGRLNDFVRQDEEEDIYFNGILFGLGRSGYENDIMLYPVTNTPMLAQVTVPKSQSSADDMVACLNPSHFFEPAMSSYSYTSPDGETELYVTQEAFLLMSSADLYLKNPDGSFTHLASLSTDDGCNPFNDKGEWFTDDEGNSVFGDRENFTITWKDNGVVVDHSIEMSYWEKVSVTFDGEVTERSTYTNNYVKWNEEDYERFNNHVYKSPDGEHALYIEQYKGQIGASYQTKIEVSQKASDGSCKPAFTTYATNIEFGLDEDYFYPFDQNLTEWSKDDEGNDVISNMSEKTDGPTFRLTWKEDCVVIEFIDGYNIYPPHRGYSWETFTVNYE